MQTDVRLRVLIVEDQSLLAMMVETVLEDAGWKVVAAVGSVPAALQAVERGGFDIALLDVNLAGRDAFPVADALIARGLPLVFATGYGIHGIRSDLHHLPVIAKPFSPTELLERLREAAGQRAMQA